MTISITLSSEDSAPIVVVVPTDKRRRFLSVHLTRDLTIYLHGYDHEAIAHARQLASVLTNAATTLEQQLQTEQTPSAVQS